VSVGQVRGLQVPSLVDALYTATRERILTGDLAAGSALTEMQLAQEYSVARPTAKSAMERLIHDGLLRRNTNKTARVPLLTEADIRDLYFSRAFLEREVSATLAAKRLVPPAAWKYVEALRNAAKNPVLTEVVTIDVDFHRSLFDAIGSSRLNRLYDSLMGEVRLCMAQVQANQLLPPERIADEHAAILSAIEAGNSRRATKEITGHLERACARLVSHVQSHPED